MFAEIAIVFFCHARFSVPMIILTSILGGRRFVKAALVWCDLRRLSLPDRTAAAYHGDNCTQSDPETFLRSRF
jgi:hypothetical protein